MSTTHLLFPTVATRRQRLNTAEPCYSSSLRRASSLQVFFSSWTTTVDFTNKSPAPVYLISAVVCGSCTAAVKDTNFLHLLHFFAIYSVKLKDKVFKSTFRQCAHSYTQPMWVIRDKICSPPSAQNTQNGLKVNVKLQHSELDKSISFTEFFFYIVVVVQQRSLCVTAPLCVCLCREAIWS